MIKNILLQFDLPHTVKFKLTDKIASGSGNRIYYITETPSASPSSARAFQELEGYFRLLAANGATRPEQSAEPLTMVGQNTRADVVDQSPIVTGQTCTDPIVVATNVTAILDRSKAASLPHIRRHLPSSYAVPTEAFFSKGATT